MANLTSRVAPWVRRKREERWDRLNVEYQAAEWIRTMHLAVSSDQAIPARACAGFRRCKLRG